MKIIIKIAELVVFFVIIAILVIAASPILPTKDVFSSYVVTSGSMEPAIMTGSLVMTQGIDPSTLDVGDVIAFTQPTDPNNTIVHRIVGEDPSDTTSFQTKGDNNNAVDNWTVLPSQVKGTIIFSIPYVGYFVSWLKTPLGFAIGLGIPALLLVLLQIKKIRQGIHEEIEKRTNEAIKRHGEHASIIAAFVLISSMMLTTHTSNAAALFTAQASVTGFSLTVASDDPTPTPTSTVTPTPSVTLSPTPTTSPTPTPETDACDSDVTISGNSGSTTHVDIECEDDIIINQSNSSTVTTTVSQSTNTGSNQSNGNTQSSTITTGSSTNTSTVSVTTQGNIVQ